MRNYERRAVSGICVEQKILGILICERRNSMEFDEGLSIFMWVVVIIGVILVIVNYILLGLGIGGEGSLPTVAPSLANMPIKASWLSTLGLLIIIGSMLVDLKKKRKSS